MRQAAATTSWRNRRLTRLALLGGVGLAMLGFGQARAHAELLDANCPGPVNDGTSLSADARLAQTFTAVHTGTVVRAEVALNKLGNDSPFTMQILNTDSTGRPVNGVLSSTTIPGSSVPSGNTTLSGTFSAPASVVAGHGYALVVTRPDVWFVTDRNSDPCPGFESYSPDQTGAFTGPDQYDEVFSVFVNPTNQFTVGKQKGTKLTATLPGPGTLTVGDASAVKSGAASAAKKQKLLKTVTKSVAGAGTVTVKLKLTKAAKQRLRANGKLTAKAAITYTPTGGDPNTQKKKLKFKQ
jgi:hypothetical protein